ncbi:NUDIX hydrolase [bacterium]|nr:NUDIX hydrolase [bacterium]
MILYDTKYLQLKKTSSKTGNDWVYAHRPNITNVVVILPVINKEETVFLIEERPPITAEYGTKKTIGLPAGLVGDIRKNETIKDAIRTELMEETGLKADKIKILSNCIASSAGCTSETYTIALAEVNNYKIIEKPIDDGGVIINRVRVKLADIDIWLKEQEKNGYILTAQMLSALYYLKEEIK